MTIEIYCLPNNSTNYVARHDDTGLWVIFPAVQGGYAQRRDWHPTPAYAKMVMQSDKHGQIYRASIAEIAHQARWLGLPDGSTISKFQKV